MGLFSSQIPTKQMVIVCRQLATAYEAGIPIIQSLDLVREQFKDPKVRQVLTDMSISIRQGASLADAAAAQGKYLPPFFIQLLHAGERGGRLDVMLKDLAQYYEDRLEMKRKVRRMMAYPMAELVAAWFLGTFALKLVNNVIGQLNTRGGGGVSDVLVDYAWFQAKAFGVAAVLFAVCVMLSRMGVLQWVWGGFTTYMWPISEVTRRLALARFFRSLSLLIGSGLPIHQCIQRSAAVTVNPYIERDLLQAVPRVKEGGTLAEAFAGSRCLTRMAREMLHVGEESGDLERQLHKVAEYHMNEASHAVNIAAKVFGVAIVLVVACVVGYVVISFYARLYGGMFDALGV